jgi:hypothetical protein
MKKIDALDDLSTLTTIPYNNIQKLSKRVGDIIAYSVQEAVKNKDDLISIGIGIGSINILVTEESLKYKFIPTPTLEKEILSAVNESNISLVSDIYSKTYTSSCSIK